MSLSIRPCRDEDYPAIADLVARVDDERPTADQLRAYAKPREGKVDWQASAFLDGSLVGFGRCQRRETFPVGKSHMTLVVREGAEGRGVGRALADLLYGQCRGFGATYVTTAVREDLERSRRFAGRQGFTECQRLYGSSVELPDPPIEVRPIEGIRIATWAELGDTPEHRRELFETGDDAETVSVDSQEWGRLAYPDFEIEVFGPRHDPEALFVAIDADRFVGFHYLGVNDEGTVNIGFTGVRPAYTGRGIATALKQAGMRWAQRAGYRTIRTHNDTRNAPMIAINRKLGFVDEPGWIYLRKELV